MATPVGEAEAARRPGVRDAVLGEAVRELLGQNAHPAVQLGRCAGRIEGLGRQHGLGQLLHLQPHAKDVLPSVARHCYERASVHASSASSKAP